jgi:hypothetical protein
MANEFDTIEAEINQGTRRDAILHSVGANSAHGLRRTNGDKQRSVMTLLNDEEWSQWPQTKIAQACGVSREYVCRLSGSIDASCDRSQDSTRTVRRGDSVYQQNTANIGHRPSAAAAVETERVIVDADTGEVIDNPATITTTTRRYSLEISTSPIEILPRTDYPNPLA